MSESTSRRFPLIGTIAFLALAALLLTLAVLSALKDIRTVESAGQVISVSMYLRSGQASVTTTSHFYSQTTSGTARGDQTSAVSISTTGRDGMSWYFISSVEAWSDPTRQALVIVGDSITDGRGSPINANLKWPSLLNDRTQATQGLSHISVVNQGSGGNQVVTDAEGPDLFQPSVLKRLQRDVLDKSGVG